MNKELEYYVCKRSLRRNTALRIKDLSGHIDFLVVNFNSDRNNRVADLRVVSEGIDDVSFTLDSTNRGFSYGDIHVKLPFPQKESNKLSLVYKVPKDYVFFIKK